MSYAMEYFRDSGLKELVDSGKIDTIPIGEVVGLVTQYIKNRREITTTQSDDPLSVFSKTSDDAQLMTDALFYNRVFVPDPIVANCGNASLLFPSIPFEKSDPSIALREAVKKAVDFYKHYSPLINDGFIAPITISNEVKQISFLIPSKDFSKNIPSHLLEFLKNSAKVDSCQSAGPNIPGSYAILLFTASDLTSITSHIHNWVLFLLWLHPSFFLELLLH